MNRRYRHWLRIILWTSVAIYTLSLPHIIIIYRAIVSRFSPNISELIPKAIIIILGILYTAFGYLYKKNLRYMGSILLCAVLIYAVLYLAPNPNKEIHVPEYIVMSWLLILALSIDYEGKGIAILVCICAPLLGIVDELLQGIHPHRYYGWEDIGMNSISAFVGVLLFLGLRNEPQGSWNWMIHLKKRKNFFKIGVFGAVGALLQCIYLFKVKASNNFSSIYPLWLLGWNALFAASVLVMMFSFYRRHHIQRSNPNSGLDAIQYNAEITSYLWVFPPVLILFIIHCIAILVAIFGWEFG
jgi:hypothetical protein